jgi:hypothetical protein
MLLKLEQTEGMSLYFMSRLFLMMNLLCHQMRYMSERSQSSYFLQEVIHSLKNSVHLVTSSLRKRKMKVKLTKMLLVRVKR